MRPGQNRRMRGRNRNNNSGGKQGPNPLTRSYESNGPDVKVRGTAQHVADKYAQLARDAQSSGDPVAAENYFQHAEHYYRIIAEAQEKYRQQFPQQRPFDEDGEDGDEDGFGFGPGREGEDGAEQPFNGPAPRGGGGNRYPDGGRNDGPRQPYGDRGGERFDGRDRFNGAGAGNNQGGYGQGYDQRRDRQGNERQGGDRQGGERNYPDRNYPDRNNAERNNFDRHGGERGFEGRGGPDPRN